jgi:hypothetical protein
MLSVPGLIIPLMAFPSQSIVMNIWLRVVLFGPQSPSQVPFKGKPSCASAAPATNAETIRQANANFMTRIYSLLTYPPII